jgi:hypothetical protein
MTEAEWLACTDPKAMLEILLCRATERKLRLFAVACCRRIWPQMTDARSRQAVELAERSTDELVSDLELSAVSAEAEEAFKESLTDDEGKYVSDDDPQFHAASAASFASRPWRLGAEHFSVILKGAWDASPVRPAQERAAQAAMLRDLIGNPFRPAALAPTWLVPPVLSLARAAYDERQLPEGTLDPTRLAVLADALEDTGCTNADVLGHLRGPGPHVRGCWVVDLLLGES